jgi:hypothetical protein
MNALARVEHRIPKHTVQLGTVLDLDVTDRGRRVFIDDWKHWLMLCDERGMETAPGRTKLFLVKMPRRTVRLDGDELERGAETYGRWHQRDADELLELDGLPDSIAYYQGRVTRIGYRSDKWHPRGKSVEYDHDCQERGGKPPMLYTSHADIARARAAVLVGGSMHLTERGIE